MRSKYRESDEEMSGGVGLGEEEFLPCRALGSGRKNKRLVFGECLDDEKRRRKRKGKRRKKTITKYIYCLDSCEWEAQPSEVFSMKYWWARQCWKLMANGSIPKAPDLQDMMISCVDEKEKTSGTSMIGKNKVRYVALWWGILKIW